ncbi:ADP-ribosylation factor-like protein [Stigmatella erecta]|uniref:Signal recognition particle receptor subunit beta, a GTPase n=1 Tax=Stigmatella erecta TaxID=83460 RepID=A0A1I0EVM7_9BACT|nr:ADP-ribosylation factor-like protein [Stigmatella erecta]SET49196.1 Signal recognition particle receptor subunit beta, a GTPase [Stigmatella erecta]
MSSVNLMAREVAAKIVFYGPGLSGKTTTLRKIYETIRPAHRGEMMSIATEGDRTLFFDFLPVKVERVNDCSVRLALYTVPGQVFYNATRKLVLQGADGVVFVADSQPEALDSNRESLQNLEENLLEQGVRLDRFPLVMQWNKRDIEKTLPVEQLRAVLNTRGVPEYETAATSGQGVLDTLKSITRLVIKDLRAKRIVPSPRPTAPPVENPGAGLEARLSQHLPPPPSHTGLPAHPPSLMPRQNPAQAATAQAPRVETPAPLTAPAPTPAGQRTLGPASALAPGDLFDYARAAEAAFASGQYGTCVASCMDAVRRALAYAGEGTLAQQGFLLRTDGADLLKLQGLSKRVETLRVDDAAFALYFLMQVFTRLNDARLPETA